MPAGDTSRNQTFDTDERRFLDDAIADAEADTGLAFSLFYGRSEGRPRDFAERLLESTADPESTVLLMCDPEERVLEVVTGSQARSIVTDSCALQVVQTLRERLVRGEVSVVEGLGRAIRELTWAGSFDVNRSTNRQSFLAF